MTTAASNLWTLPFIPYFTRYGFRLKNRIIWRYAHGLHLHDRLSGRYETLLWYVKNPTRFTFNLDEVRVPIEVP